MDDPIIGFLFFSNGPSELVWKRVVFGMVVNNCSFPWGPFSQGHTIFPPQSSFIKMHEFIPLSGLPLRAFVRYGPLGIIVMVIEIVLQLSGVFPIM